MKISIITPTFNSLHILPHALHSVRMQTGVTLEHIVVDGCSTDGTLDFLHERTDLYDVLLHGPDRGLYDAMNKGLRQSTGDVVGILNADDFYPHPAVLQKVALLFDKTDAQAVYGDLLFVDAHRTTRIRRRWQAGPYRRQRFLYGWMPPHPCFFVRRDLYERYGMFDLHFRSSADYELMLRFMYKHHIKPAYLPEVLVHMRTGGQSNASWSNRLRAKREVRAAWKNNALKPLPVTTLLKPIRKIPQFWVRKRMLPPAITLFPGTQAHIETELEQVHGNNIV